MSFSNIIYIDLNHLEQNLSNQSQPRTNFEAMIEKENLKNQENIFKVPDGYFEGFDHRLKARINPKKAHSTNSKLSIIKPWLMLAAAFILLTMVYNLISKHFLDSSTNNFAVTQTTEEAEVWTDESFGISELMDYLTQKNEETNSVEIYSDSLIFDDLTHEDFILLSHLDY